MKGEGEKGEVDGGREGRVGERGGGRGEGEVAHWLSCSYSQDRSLLRYSSITLLYS